MMDVTRLQGIAQFGTYVISIFAEKGRIDHIDINGKPNKDTADACKYFSNAKTKRVRETIDVIKLTMGKRNEYRGEICFSSGTT